MYAGSHEAYWAMNSQAQKVASVTARKIILFSSYVLVDVSILPWVIWLDNGGTPSYTCLSPS